MKKQIIAGLLITACASSIANASVAEVPIPLALNDTAEYLFTDLSEHTSVKLNFDLFIMGSWDGGNTEYSGPDKFGFSIGGVVEQSWSFRNAEPTSEFESNNDRSWEGGDFNSSDEWENYDRFFANYADGFTIAHDSDSLKIVFFGKGLQEATDESWRVENVSLTTVPVPTAVWLFGSALLGLAGARRKAL